MKTGVIATKTIASDDIKDTRSVMGMSAKGMDIATFYLRDKIYSDKVLAVVREYISNAYDEHVKHNIDRDIDVTLKSENSQFVWAVRDYAKGLNEHDIRNIFGVYFESTKSNENSSIGGFGIGGKAGFSYTDTFYVNSHHNGLKSSYVCTLGAGTKGIPVGEIYKISEEPTTEQGIEISLEVKYSDLESFSNKTEKFVNFFTPTAKIKFTNKYYPDEHFPYVPENTVDIGEYKFSTYNDQPFYSSRYTYFVRMGGVCYPHSATTKKHRTFTKTVIVDVPIGKLTIPISRESIENTPLNDKVYQEIERCLDKIAEDESKGLLPPKFGNISSGHETMSKSYDGVWFQYDYITIFPKTRKWYYKTSKFFNDIGGFSGQVSKGPKHIVYLMPNIKNDNNWHKRLINALKKVQGDDYVGYVSMCISDYEAMIQDLDNTIDISDCVFVDVKTLKLPKLEKIKVDNTSYQVFEGYGYKRSYTAEELNQKVIDRIFGGKEPDDDWYLEAKDMGGIHHRTIGLVSDFGTRTSYYTANSVKMIEALKELGWLTPNCPEYQDMANKFRLKIERQRVVANAENKLRELYFGTTCKNLIVNHIKKNPEKIDKLEGIVHAILRESTTRGRILQSIRDYNRKITREDLRKILQLKD